MNIQPVHSTFRTRGAAARIATDRPPEQAGAASRPAPGLDRAWPVAILLLVLPALGCGPTPREAGTTVALLGTFVFAASTALLHTLQLIWRRFAPVRPPTHRWFIAVAVHVAFGVLGLLVGTAGAAVEWFGIGFWALGTSHLAVSLVVWRIWVWLAPNSALEGAPIVASILLLPLALPMAAGWVPAEGPIIWLWVMPGYAGWVPGILFAVLLVEAFVRFALWRRGEGRSARDETD